MSDAPAWQKRQVFISDMGILVNTQYDYGMQSVESEQRYLRLLSASHEVASHIVKSELEAKSGSARFIYEMSRRLVERVDPVYNNALSSSGSIFEFLRCISGAWPQLAAGKIDGEELLAGKDLWAAIMTEWPMDRRGVKFGTLVAVIVTMLALEAFLLGLLVFRIRQGDFWVPAFIAASQAYLALKWSRFLPFRSRFIRR